MGEKWAKWEPARAAIGHTREGELPKLSKRGFGSFGSSISEDTSITDPATRKKWAATSVGQDAVIAQDWRTRSPKPPRPAEPTRPPDSTASSAPEWKFDGAYARLFPLLGKRVHTPAGVGKLEQVFKTRVSVTLEAQGPGDELRMTFFKPEEIAIYE